MNEAIKTVATTLLLLGTTITAGWAAGTGDAGPSAPAAPSAPSAAAPSPAPAAAPARPYYYQYSLLQFHAFPNYQAFDKDIFKVFFERISSSKYADDYFFLGVTSSHERNWDSNVAALYFKYAPCLDLDHVFNTKILPVVGDTYLTVQVNAGDLDYYKTVYLAGVAVDAPALPNYGRLRAYALVRKEDTNRTTHQFTVMWAQPFTTGTLKWVFAGWGAHWNSDDVPDIVKFEPQLRLRLSSFFGENHFLSNGIIGTELEFSHHYQYEDGKDGPEDWVINPSIFYAIPF